MNGIREEYRTGVIWLAVDLPPPKLGIDFHGAGDVWCLQCLISLILIIIAIV